MTSRTAARREAVEILYAADVREIEAETLLAERPEASSYAAELVHAVTSRRAELDAVLAEKAPQWPVKRMSAVDRNILRLGLVELSSEDVPGAVAIDEAVGLAKQMSGEAAGRFVNGVLGAVLADRQASDAGRSSA